MYYNWRRYYDPKTGRYISVDPLGLSGSGSLYGYAGNNPLSFTDPTGLWLPHYNPNGNRIGVTMEPGDELAGLINQLGISYEEFARRHSVNNVFFDITENVLRKNYFDPGPDPSKNCYGFVSYAGGAETKEGRPPMVNLEGKTKVAEPHTGDWAIFYESGQYQYEGQAAPQNATDPGHAAIFVLRDHSGEAWYINRINTGEAVSLVSGTQMREYFGVAANVQKGLDALGQGYKLILFPTLNPTPKFYR